MEFTIQSRLLIIGFALMPFVRPEISPWLFVVIFGIKSIPEAIGQTSFQGFTGDLFDDDFRSTAISLRNKLGTPVAILISLATGYILRVFPKSDDDRMVYYQIFFIISVIFGILETLSFKVINEPTVQVKQKELNLKAIFREMKSQKKFISFTISSLLFYFGWQMGWPLFNIYQVVYLGADEFWLSVIFVVTSIGSYVGYGYWNKMIQKRGNAIVASITTLGMAFNPVLIAICPNLYWVSAINLLTGFFTSGNVTVLLNALLEATPQENRVIYVGTYNTLINLSLMISPIAAHGVLQLVGIFWAFIIVALIRFAGSVVFYLNHTKNIAKAS
jgi:MFS family permease